MNPFQLVLKQMRQRALGTWLTMLSIVLGVALAVAVLLVRQGSQSLFGQTNYGYDMIVGKGSPMQLVLNSVYHIDRSPGNIPYSLYKQLANPRHPQVRLAAPIAVGDTYQGHRVVATTPAMFGATEDGSPIEPATDENGNLSGRIFQYAGGKRFEFAQGKSFHARKFQAVIGSDIPKLAGLKMGDKLQVAHDAPAGGKPDVHEEKWEVVGVLKPTHTANDRCVFIPLVSTFAIEKHGEGMVAQSAIRRGERPPAPGSLTATTQEDHDADHDEHEGEEHHHHHKAYTMSADGLIQPNLPESEWLISAIFVKGRSSFLAQQAGYAINAGGDATAVYPGLVMSEFFGTFLAPITLVLLLISALVTVVAAVGILVSIYNSVAARRREIAILRALGATRGRVVTLICLEAGLIGLVGGLIGWAVGILIGAVASYYMDQHVGQGFAWWIVTAQQVQYLIGVVVLAVLAGLAPALKAYRTPVATNLSAV